MNLPHIKRNIILIFSIIACSFYLLVIYFRINESKVKLRSNEYKLDNIIKNFKKTKEKNYLINTPGCLINDLPLYDEEIKHIYSDIEKNVWKCERKSRIKINRFDETSIQLNWTEVGYKPFCYYRQLSRGSEYLNFKYGIL